MNFIAGSNSNGNISLFHISCGGGSSCGSDQNAKRAASAVDKQKNHNGSSCS